MIKLPEDYPFSEPLIFDSHSHYDDEKFSQDRDKLFDYLPRAGVRGIITCGCDPHSNEESYILAEKYDFVYFSCGIHPQNADCLKNATMGELLDGLRGYARKSKCVAIGEIGLDYYWTKENISCQRQLFRSQTELAIELDMPVIVHDRDAHEDTLNILREYRPKGVVHSFSGSLEMSREIFNMGMYIGISGVITFKNARKLPEVVKNMPMDRFLLETDAPYLTPVPFRSSVNHSAMIYYSAAKIAEIRGTGTAEILNAAYENARRLFGTV